MIYILYIYKVVFVYNLQMNKHKCICGACSDFFSWWDVQTKNLREQSVIYLIQAHLYRNQYVPDIILNTLQILAFRI